MIFAMKEEAIVPRKNSHRFGVNMRSPHREARAHIQTPNLRIIMWMCQRNDMNGKKVLAKCLRLYSINVKCSRAY